MEEAERQRWQHNDERDPREAPRQEWHQGHDDPSRYAVPVPPPLPPPRHAIYPRGQPWNPAPYPAIYPPQQQQHLRFRPPHPDSYSPIEFPFQTSPDISPLHETSYPIYPTPHHTAYSDPSPSASGGGTSATSSPSPFAAPVSLPPASDGESYLQSFVHQPTYGAVESARWMATIEGPGEDTIPPQFSQPPSRPYVPAPAHSGLTGFSFDEPAEMGRNDGAHGDHEPPDSSLDAPFPADQESRGGEQPTPMVKPFIEKLYGILSHPETYGDVLKWSDAGDTFFVAHSERFIREVLRDQFSHQNIHSFTRQLNVYNFVRMSIKQLRDGLSIPSATTADYSGWSHPQFRRGDTSTLALLVPRPSRARLLKKLEKQSAANLNRSHLAALAHSSAASYPRRVGGPAGGSGLDYHEANRPRRSSQGDRGTEGPGPPMSSLDEYG
ncbi:hypothetical protein JCM3766R1_002260 [Sporobolomyces carnicolor]